MSSRVCAAGHPLVYVDAGALIVEKELSRHVIIAIVNISLRDL